MAYQNIFYDVLYYHAGELWVGLDSDGFLTEL